jgi:hypothetical protein
VRGPSLVARVIESGICLIQISIVMMSHDEVEHTDEATIEDPSSGRLEMSWSNSLCILSAVSCMTTISLRIVDPESIYPKFNIGR